jgi:hypothetical protein
VADIINEKGVKHRVKKRLDKYDWFWWMPPANGFGKAGISDFNALKNGVFVAIETKFGANKPTAMQVAFCHSIQSQKGFAFVVNEKNIEWFERWLECFDNAVQGVLDAKGGDPAKAVSPDDGADLLNAIKVLTEML